MNMNFRSSISLYLISLIYFVVLSACACAQQKHSSEETIEAAAEKKQIENLIKLEGMEKRYLGQQAVFLNWLTNSFSLTEKQLDEIKIAQANALHRAMKAFKETLSVEPIHGFKYLPHACPILFGLSPVGMSSLQDEQFTHEFNAIVGDDLARAIVEKFNERESALDKSYVRQMVTVIDEQVFLTPQQIDEVTTRILNSPNHHQRDLYVFVPHNNDYPYPYKPVVDVIELISPVLTPLQLKRVELIKESRNFASRSRKDVIEIPVHSKDVQSLICQGVARQYDLDSVYMAISLAVKSAYIARLNNLSSEKARELEIAALGDIERLAATNRSRSINYYFNRLQEGRVGERITLPQITAYSAVNVPIPIWMQTARRLDTTNVLMKREQRRYQETLSHLTNVLDQELWLSSTQRLKLEVLIDQKLGPDVIVTDLRFAKRDCDAPELLNIARILLRLPDSELDEILTQNQTLVWREMASLFLVHDDIIVSSQWIDIKIGTPRGVWKNWLMNCH